VQLGVVGLGLFIVLWLHLVYAIRSVSRGLDPFIRYDVRILVPIVVSAFPAFLFANPLSIRFVSERFFIAAGLILGLHYLSTAEGQFAGTVRPARSIGASGS
jgi:hypothetical protein